MLTASGPSTVEHFGGAKCLLVIELAPTASMVANVHAELRVLTLLESCGEDVARVAATCFAAHVQAIVVAYSVALSADAAGPVGCGDASNLCDTPVGALFVLFLS